MTIEEASETYCIPIKMLKEYEQMKLCGTVKKIMGKWQYDEQDLQRLSMMMTLHDIGFSSKEIDEYMRLLLSGEKEDSCLNMLNQKRKVVLDTIHLYEKQLSHLDYLRHEIQKNKTEKGNINI